MSNILQLQQTILDLNDRLNREIQFGEDSQRELLATVSLMGETLKHMESQINRMFNERNASLFAALGQPVRPQTVDMTTVAEPLPSLRAVKTGIVENEAEVAG